MANRFIKIILLKNMLLPAIIISSFFSGCKKEDSPVAAEKTVSEELIPLKEGNMWVYVDSVLDFQKNKFQYRGSSKLQITGRTTINYGGSSKEVYCWDWFNMRSYEASHIEWLYGKESDGLAFYGVRFHDSIFPAGKSLTYKYPVKAGDKWTSERYSFSPISPGLSHYNTADCKCISEEEIFRTGCGDMHCKVFMETDASEPGRTATYYYFAKGIGIAGQEVKTHEGKVVRKKILQHYKINR